MSRLLSSLASVRLTRSIFDSASERAAFRALEDRWSTTLDLYPQLPLSKIVELEHSDDLREGELRTFYGTNVDYTFCDKSDRPLFSIEFDGIGRGFSHDGAYRHARPTVSSTPSVSGVGQRFRLRSRM